MGRSSISKREFSRTRDYLLTTCLLQNASQPGPLENALVQPFKQVVFCSATNTWTLLVDHQGPAEIVLDETLHRWMTIYAKYIRPQFPAEEDEHLFIKDDGLPFSTGIIGKRVTEVFKSAGVCPDMRITATSICKMYSSAFDLTAVQKRLVHHHMKPCEATADRNYVLRVNAERSARAHSLLKGIPTGQDMATED